MPHISVVSPVYKAENIVDELVKRIIESVSKITDDFEIILVEDGSPDNSWQMIEKNCEKDNRVKGIKLSRNFGQHYGVTAGIENCIGQFIIVMDCDLQDDPGNITLLYREINKGFDIVFTKREKRNDTFIKKISSKIYNLLFNLLSDQKYDLDNGTMVIFNQVVRDSYCKLKDHDRLYIQLLKWLGFKDNYIIVKHNSRIEGNSSYTFKKLIKLGIIGWTSFSNRLLNFSIYFGLFLAVINFTIGLYIVGMYFFRNYNPGWPSLFVAILFSTGLILLSIGIMGIYIGKTYNQVKDKTPFYN